MKKDKKGSRIIIAGVLALMMTAITACGGAPYSSKNSDSATTGMSSAGTMNGYSGDIYQASPEEMKTAVAYDSAEGDYDRGDEAASAEVTQEQENVADNRKLITNVNLSVETEEFDTLIATLESKIKDLGGYIQTENLTNGSSYSDYRMDRNAYIEARIPQKNLSSFVTVVTENSNITNKSTNVQDVTLTYVDTESRKNMYLAEQESLLKLLENASTMEDIVALEQRLFDIRYEIESLESTLRTYDNLVDYSTVYININEVKKLTVVVEEELTTWESIRIGFSESMDDIKEDLRIGWINFVVDIPYIVVFLVKLAFWAFWVFIIFLIVRGIIRKKKKKASAKLNQASGNGGKTDAAADSSQATEKTGNSK